MEGNNRKLCFICCFSFDDALENEEITQRRGPPDSTVFKSFCQHLEEIDTESKSSSSNSSAEEGGKRKKSKSKSKPVNQFRATDLVKLLQSSQASESLGICQTCLNSVEKAMKIKLKMNPVEERVRKLQSSILKELRTLQSHTEEFKEEMKVIKQTIFNSDVSCLQFHTGRAGKRRKVNTERDEISLFREKVVKVSEDLDLFQQNLQSMTGGSSSSSSSFQTTTPNTRKRSSVRKPGAATSEPGIFPVPEIQHFLKVEVEEKYGEEIDLSDGPNDEDFVFNDSPSPVPSTSSSSKPSSSSAFGKYLSETGISLSGMGHFTRDIVSRALKRNAKPQTTTEVDESPSSQATTEKSPTNIIQDDPRKIYYFNYLLAPENKLMLGNAEVFIDEETKSLSCSICSYSPILSETKTTMRAISKSMEKNMVKHIFQRHMECLPCPYCGLGLSSEWQLKQHLRQHKGLDIITCEICGRPATSGDSIAQHRWTHMNEEERKEALEKGAKDPRMKYQYFRDKQACLTFQCFECGKQFPSMMSHNQHRKRAHKAQDTVVCPTCGKTMKRRTYIVYHEKYGCPGKEIQRVKCLHCDQTFKSLPAMKKHMGRTHDKVAVEMRPHICDICGKRYKTRDCLATHKKIHTVERAFICAYPGCGRDFNTQKNWKRHSDQCKFRHGQIANF